MPENLDQQKPGTSLVELLQRLYAFLTKTQPPQVAPAPQRESSAEILSRTQLSDREVVLDDISIHRLGINWAALVPIGVAVNRLQRTALDRYEIRNQLQEVLTPDVFEGIPLVCSTIANHGNKDIPVLTPNEEEVKALRPLLREIAIMLEGISPMWRRKFDRYIERRAEDLIADIASRVISITDGFSKIDDPKAEFVPELTDLYTTVAEPQYRIETGFFGDEEQVEVRIEDKINHLLWVMYNLRNTEDDLTGTRPLPLISLLLRLSGFPPDTFDSESASIAGSELMKGLERFLRQHGQHRIPRAPETDLEFDFFDIDSWTRTLAEIFAPEKLEDVVRELPGILDAIRNFLPEDGPHIAESIQTMAENILILKQQGYTSQQIAQAITAPKALQY